MKKLIAIPGSSSSKSINKQLVAWAATQVQEAEVEVLDLNDFEMPLYSSDREESDGIPDQAKIFTQKVSEADGVLLSLAEHNGSYASAFKNILDWSSRHQQKVWADKKMFLMSSSPGGRGGQTVRTVAEQYFPYMGADIVATFGLPKFYDNFEDGVKDGEFKAQFESALAEFQKSL